MAILDFSVSGRHGFGSVTQVCFGISVLNFICMSFVAVARSLTIVSYVAFKMAALWFWTKFNCDSPIAHCHPLLWGRGILVDHWSTISSLVLDDVWAGAELDWCGLRVARRRAAFMCNEAEEELDRCWMMLYGNSGVRMWGLDEIGG